MFKRTKISTGVLLALSGVLLSPVAVYAQETQRVEITGSAIRRLNTEGALPVTTISRADIERSGATSVAELLQKLPSMGNFTTTSESINGGGGGTTTASVHGLGEDYTLVLLNGRRMAPFNTGSTVNLNSLPLAAIERVEVLTDGASALYGSDAIGGVVNFILRRNQTEGAISIAADKVENKGGDTRSISITKGFGDLDRDGFNVLFSLSHDQQKNLKAVNRPFSKTGIIRGIDGQNAGLRLFSSNTVPGTVLLQRAPDDPLTGEGYDLAFYTPHLFRNDSCPALHVVAGATCRFDFASQVELVPESKNTTGLLSARLNLGKNHQLFTELLASKFVSKPEFAPPAQPGLYLTQALYDEHVLPFLTPDFLDQADGYFEPVGGDPSFAPTMNVRVFDAGGRKNRYSFDTTHFAVGSEGQLIGWDYRASLTASRLKSRDKMIGGYLSANRFNEAIENGTYDPLGMVAGEARQALASAVLNEEDNNILSTYNTVNVSASRPVFSVGGGEAALAVGGEVARQRFKQNPSPIAQGRNALQPDFTDSIIGGSGGALPFDTTRNSYGVFAELLVPVTKTIEVTGAVRYDSYDAAENSKGFDTEGNPIGKQTQGKKADAATFKLSGRFQPTRQVLLRSSFGTGFKAPTLFSVARPQQAFGVTSASYDCPFTSGPLLPGCRPPDSQYNQLNGGNSSTGSDALKPEKSKQFTAGFVLEPTQAFSLGVDYWRVELRDKIDSIPEQVAFANPEQYANLFTIAPDPVTGQNQLTFIIKPVNFSKAKYEGFDLDATFRATTDIGRITTNLSGTYTITADYQVPGLPGFQSSLGKFGIDNAVAFRWVLRGSVTLDAGNWSTTVGGNFRSGYRDHVARCSDTSLTDAECNAAVAAGTEQWVGPEIRTVNPTTGAFGARRSLTRQVAEYITFDFQTKYSFTKALDLTFGIRNVFDEAPPFSVQDAGGGNMRGFDGRYADPIGRTYYLKANYKF
jgi:iron complex outermembrane recepter protein